MQVVKIILVVVQFILCLAVTVLAMMQSKDDAGLSSTIKSIFSPLASRISMITLAWPLAPYNTIYLY